MNVRGSPCTSTITFALRAGQAPRGERTRSDVRVGRDQDVRPVRTQLPRQLGYAVASRTAAPRRGADGSGDRRRRSPRSARAGRRRRRARPISSRATPGRGKRDAAPADEEHARLSSGCRLLQDLLEPRVDVLAADRGNGRLGALRRADREARRRSSMRCSAAASAATSPGGTSRPFSSSWITSGTPPTAVATTGAPTASASTAACGRFSQRLGRTAARAPASARRTSSREREPANVDPVAECELPDARLERTPARARPRRRADAQPGTSTSAASATGSPFCDASRPTYTNVPGASWSGTTSVGGGAGLTSTSIGRPRPHPAATSAR